MARKSLSTTSFWLGTALLMAATSAPPALAQDTKAAAAPPQTISPTEPPTPGAEYPAGDTTNPVPAPIGPFAAWWEWKSDLKDKGIDFTLAYRSEDLAAVSGGSNGRLVHAGQIALTSQYGVTSRFVRQTTISRT